MKKIIIAALAAVPCVGAHAQVNKAGTFQIGLAGSLGIFATHFENDYSFLGFHQTNSKNDGAATVSYPLDLQVGIAKPISMGLYLEPGSYLDSSGTRTNSFLIAGLSPRFYAVNKDRFAWLFNLDVGLSALRISDVVSGGQRYTDSYMGGHFRIGTQIQFYFGDHFGLHFGTKYSFHNMPWRNRDPKDPNIQNASYAATLTTSGVQFDLGMQVKF